MQLTLFIQKMLKKSVLCTQGELIQNFTSYNDASEVFAELFKSLRSRYQGYLETSTDILQMS